MLKKLLRCRALEHAALSDEGDAVGGAARKAHFVCDENDGFSGFTQLGNHIEDFGSHLRIECGSGFVQKQKSGIDRKGPGNGDTLSLATAELGGLLGRVFDQVEALQDIHRPLTRGCYIEPVNLGEWQHDISERAEVGKEVEGLKNNTGAAAVESEMLLVPRQRLAVDKDFTRIGGIEAG